MPIPVGIGFIGFIGLVVVILLTTNLWLILSGTGTWLNHSINDRRPPKIRYFPPLRVGIYRIPLPNIVLPCWGLFVLGLLCYEYQQETLHYLPFAEIIAGVAVSLFVVYLIMLKMTDVYKGGDGWRVFKLYLEARKDKVCPIVDFIEPEKPGPGLHEELDQLLGGHA